MPFDVADPTYRDLLSQVLRSGGSVVPFVGAGLSLYGDRAERLPDWRELLECLVDEGRDLELIPKSAVREIDEDLRRHRYVDAMETLCSMLGEPTFRRVVEDALDDAGKPVPPAMAELVAVGWSLIVTTNLDRMIARAYLDRHGRPMPVITGHDTRRLAKAVVEGSAAPETKLAQIHGSVEVYESWLLTRTQYARLLADSGYVLALQALFLRNLFFIGFGLRDDDFDRILETITTVYPAGVGEFFALVPRTRRRSSAFRELVKRGGFRPIFYDVDEKADASDPHGGHGAVYECLEHLASQWELARNDLDVTLKYLPELDPTIVDRPEALERLADIAKVGGRVGQVVGLGGLGKTSLVLQFLQEKRAEIAGAGYDGVFGCSFYRADIGQFIQDMALATVGATSGGSLPRQVDDISDHVRQRRVLLVLDGLEAILDTDGTLRSTYVLQILESVVAGGGAALVTSRIPATGGALESSRLIEVDPLSPAQIDDFLRGWGLERLGEAAAKRLAEITGGHPLALRVLAGVLQDVPADEAIATIERSAVINLADEVDPLRENRLARIIGSYFHHLDEAEVAFLSCLTAFEKPAPFTLIGSAFTSAYPDTAINKPLVESDLRPLVARLRRRRLLTASPTGEISCHPTVREYFAGHADRTGSLAPIHRYLAAEGLRGAPRQPDTFEEATQLIDACRHAAACRDWNLFDDIFRHRLMRGYRDYLCDTLGAWDETLALATFGDDPEFANQPASQPGYYPIAVARCLKHLGRTSESRTKYLRALKELAASKDPDTTMYVNNFMTLLVWRGELTSADWLIELNVRALSWVKEPWKHRWQVDHGFSSIAYLKLLQGNLPAADTLYEHSERAWDGFSGTRPAVYDYYSFYRSELTLLADPDAHGEALAEVASLLSIADASEAPESLCRGHIQAAVIRIDRATREGDLFEIEKAAEHLERARLTTAGMNVADVTVAHHMARLKAELAKHEIGAEGELGPVELKELVDRIALLVSTSGLLLTMPEVTAARGALAYLDGSLGRAEELYERATRQCRRQGNALALRSPRSLIGWLGRRLGRRTSSAPTDPPTPDLIGLVGSRLSPQWMLRRLETLPGSG